MKIAYLVNQYPKVSHSFIRREILALEKLGVHIQRYAIRGWDEAAIDPADESERQQTSYILRAGVAALLRDAARVLLVSPRRFLRALRLAVAQWRRGDRSLALNIVTLIEAAWLRERLRRSGVEHLHSHFGTNGTMIAQLCRLMGGPTYSFTVHGPDEFDAPRQLGLDLKVAGASFVVAISNYTAAQLERWVFPSHRGRIHVIRCGLDEAFLEIDGGEVPDTDQFVCVGRLSAQKAQVELVQAIAALRDEGVQVRLVLAGDGDSRTEIEQIVAERELHDAVRLAGWVNEATVRQELLSCRALVLPSRAEGLPLVLMEALALRRPVVTTYIAGIPELVASAQCGWLVPAAEPHALTQALRQCLQTSAKELTEMADRGRAAVLTRHHIGTEARRLMGLFSAAIGERRV